MIRNGSFDKVTVYTSESSLRKPVQFVVGMFQDLWVAHELAWRLAVRDISAQYRQTALGMLWVFILPLGNALVWIFLQRSGVVAVGEASIPYPAYVFSGTILWSIFQDAVNAPLQQTTAARPILARINFPREALIVSGIHQALFNAVIKFAVLVPALAFFGILPGWDFLLLPFGIFALVLAGTAVGLFLTPIGMFYTDIGKALPLLMQLLMYLAPVVFVVPAVGWAATVFRLNPLTPLIRTARDWLTGMPVEHLGNFLAVNLFMIALLFVSWIIYRAAMPILVERMSS